MLAVSLPSVVSPETCARLLAVICLAMVCACASPNPTLYTLSVVPGQALGGAPAVIRIREISIARYLDRPQIVRGADANQLDVRANELWGEPLGAMLSRVLAEELAQRLPHSMVFGEHGAVSPTADATVLISVEQLDADGPGAVALVAHTSVSFKNGSSQPVLATVRVRIPGDTVATSSEVAAMSTAVGQLADRIAETLRTGGAGT